MGAGKHHVLRTAKDISGEKGTSASGASLSTARTACSKRTNSTYRPSRSISGACIGHVIPRRGHGRDRRFPHQGRRRRSGHQGHDATPAPTGQASRAEVTMSPMPLATLKALWPRALGARRARMGRRACQRCRISKAAACASPAANSCKAKRRRSTQHGERLSATFEVADIMRSARRHGAGRLRRVRSCVSENNALEMTMPDAAATSAGRPQGADQDGASGFADVIGPRPDGELTFQRRSRRWAVPRSAGEPAAEAGPRSGTVPEGGRRQGGRTISS